MSIPPISGPPPSYNPQDEDTPQAGMTKQEFDSTTQNLVNDAAYTSNNSTQSTDSQTTPKSAWDYETKQAAKGFDQSVKENRQKMKESSEQAKKSEAGG